MTFTRRKLFAALVAGFPLARVARPLRPQRQYTYPSKCQHQMGIDFFWPHNEAMPPWQFRWTATEIYRKAIFAANGRDIHWAAPPLPGGIDGATILEGPFCQPPLPICRYIRVWDGLRNGWVHRFDVMVEFEDV